jgi:stage II sporulation protein D
MSALVLLGFIAAKAATDVSVVVLSRHRPTELAVRASACTVDERRTDVASIRVHDGAVQFCPSTGACTTHGTARLSCASDISLTMPGEAARRYGRALNVRVDKGVLRVVANVSLESYTSAVVASELYATENAALDAVSVVVRTYAAHARARPRHDDAMLCDLTHCQVMKTVATTGASVDAAARTRGQVLVQRDKTVAPVFHHAACGGHTIAATALWPDRALRDVIGVPDRDAKGRAFCAASPHATWVSEVDDVAVARALSRALDRPFDAPSLALEPKDDDGIRFVARDAHGETEISGLALTRAIGRELTWSVVKSQRFVVERAGRKLRIKGTGFGHRVGLCQEGTRARARAGASASAILRAYFPKFTVASVDDTSESGRLPRSP